MAMIRMSPTAPASTFTVVREREVVHSSLDSTTARVSPRRPVGPRPARRSRRQSFARLGDGHARLQPREHLDTSGLTGKFSRHTDGRGVRAAAAGRHHRSRASERLTPRTPRRPWPDGTARDTRAVVESRLAWATSRSRTTVNVLAGAVGLIRIIAIVNVAWSCCSRADWRGRPSWRCAPRWAPDDAGSSGSSSRRVSCSRSPRPSSAPASRGFPSTSSSPISRCRSRRIPR